MTVCRDHRAACRRYSNADRTQDQKGIEQGTVRARAVSRLRSDVFFYTIGAIVTFKMLQNTQICIVLIELFTKGMYNIINWQSEIE